MYSRNCIRISPFKKPDAINLNGKASTKYSNIKSNRNDSSSYENLKSDILDFTKKNKKIIIACSSLGSSERVAKILINNLKKAKVEGKGVLNNRISEYILTNLSQCGIKNHLVKRLNMREQLIRKAEIFPIEFIVRNIATGSLTKRLGIPEGTHLEKPLLEYCFKKDELNDPLISKDHIFSFGWATENEIKIIDQMTLRINDLLTGMFRAIGIKLVDFKLEYGKAWNKDTEKKEIVLADEISPDTCRLWDVKTEKKLDKDRFRKDLGNIIQAYQEVARRLGIMPEETNISEVNFGKTIPIKFKKK